MSKDLCFARVLVCQSTYHVWGCLPKLLACWFLWVLWNFWYLNRYNLTADCSVSLTFDAEFDPVTADTLHTFKVKGSQRDVTYQQQKGYKSRTDRLIEFKLGGSYPSMSCMFKVIRFIDRRYNCGRFSICTVKKTHTSSHRQIIAIFTARPHCSQCRALY